MLEILNLDRKEVISIEGISDQDFSQVIELYGIFFFFFSFVLSFCFIKSHELFPL